MDHDATIRSASASDAETLVELRSRMLRELGLADDARIAELATHSVAWLAPALEAGRAAGWLAERGALVIGGASMTILSTQPQLRSFEGRVASIYGLYVEPAERGTGVATSLVRAAVAFAKRSGIDLVTLHAADKARPLYERIGFERSSEMRLFLSD